MRGRKPTATVIKLLRKNPGKRRLNTKEPTPPPIPEDVPRELTDPAAIAEWQRGIVPAIKIGQITVADRALAIGHCQLWATWTQYVSDAAENPYVMTGGKHPHLVINPARPAAHKTLQLLATIDEKLGFSPTSRSKITAAPMSGPLSADDAFFGGRPRGR